MERSMRIIFLIGILIPLLGVVINLANTTEVWLIKMGIMLLGLYVALTIWILTDFWLLKLTNLWRKWAQLVCLVKFYTMQHYSPDLTELLFR